MDSDPFGYVDENDVALLKKYLANEATLNRTQIKQANVNGDDTVNQADLDLLIKYVNGEITSFTSNS